MFPVGNFILHVGIFCLYQCENHGKQILQVEVKLRIFEREDEATGMYVGGGRGE